MTPIDARCLSWVSRHRWNAVLIFGWTVMIAYLAVYFGGGYWRMR